MYSKMMLPIELTKILYSSWEGQISISSQDSQIYGKCLNGFGSVTFKNGNKYQGNFYNGLLSGKGKFTWANGIIYQGEFTDNRITGTGVYKWPDGSLYEGQVKDGLRHGVGKLVLDDASYEGQWYEGKKHGKGKIIFKSGSIFEGYFKNDMKNGIGKMYYYPSGNFFEGQWKNDLKEGKGTMNWIDIRQKYVGDWHANLQHGFGTHLWLESKGQGKYLRNRYEGGWGKGVRSGFGTFYYANGAKYEGYWIDNMKEGYALYTNENGQVNYILFQKDRMIKSQKSLILDSQSSKKVTGKKQVEPNAYSLSLDINHFYQPQIPNTELLFNYLLRNNTQLKSWYRGLANFYDQQSEYSFCLNLQGVWKMIRGLKILGDFSLAALDRGLESKDIQVETILKIIQQKQKTINFQRVFYQQQASNIIQSAKKSVKIPFKLSNIHNKNKNLLFRQFVHLIVWIAHIFQPNLINPKISVEKLLMRIGPTLQNITKTIKTGSNDNVSQNFSTVSKTQKAITPFFRKVNTDLLQILTNGIKEKRILQEDISITLKEIIGYGKLAQIIAQPQLTLLERILQKYIDTDTISRQKSKNWVNSSISTKLLNLMNYQFIEFQFIQLIYIILIKKLPTHKQTEQNKIKYQQLIDQIKKTKEKRNKIEQQQKQFIQEPRLNHSKKSKEKQVLLKNRQIMEKQRKIRQQKINERNRQIMEAELMKKQDINIKDQDFEQEESQLEI